MNVFLFALMMLPSWAISQCQTTPGQIKGHVFLDHNFNGQKDVDETTSDKVVVFAFDQNGDEVTSAIPDQNGRYVLDGLTDGNIYRLNVQMPEYLKPSIIGADNASDVRILESPACAVSFAVANPADYCDSDNPDVAVTCFVKGEPGVNDDMETVVLTPYLFNNKSVVSKVSNKGETGSVFGTAWRSGSQELFLSSFVKQDAYLNHGPDAIFRAQPAPGGMFQTSLWLKLSDLGINAGTLSVQSAQNCSYGAQVGKIGIGSIEISQNEEQLYVVNLANKSIVIINIDNPTPGNTIEIPIPQANCSGGEMRPFAVREHEGLLYVTTTCDASITKDAADHKVGVWTLDLSSNTFEEVFTTDFTREYWLDQPSNHTKVNHWLTDIEFTTNGNMVLGVADRQSHRYCHASRDLINQYPDVLLVWNDNGEWKLENNGRAGQLTGSGVNNGQGPGGGEFFGEDYWILGPLYHPEIATGSLFSLPGSDDVVCTVFDPIYSTFSGGFHRYSTINGSKTAAIELYTNTNQNVFGKGSGLGNIIDMCGPAPIQIGNFVWIDENQNGVQDAGEQPVADLELSLIDDQCEVVGQTTTDANGHYYFSNGVGYHSSYHVVVSDARYDVNEEGVVINNDVYKLTHANAGQGAFQNVTDNDAELMSGVGCDLVDNKLAIKVVTSGPGYSDYSFDMGLSTEEVIVSNPDTFDLALLKEVADNRPVKIGQMVDFNITIFNQGQVTAHEIEIVEYIPSGFEFVPMLNPGWFHQNGALTYNYMGEIQPGESATVTISLQITKADTPEDYINYAEIASAKDPNGDIAVDIDSQADRDNTNDVGGEPDGPTDNEYNDDGTIDEDDHDPAMVKIFDLALIKTTSKDAPVVRGEDVEFEIQIFNQGQIGARNIQVVDYLPQGLSLSGNDTNGWNVDGGLIRHTIAQELAPGESTTVKVLLNVGDVSGQSLILNQAEIAYAEDVFGEDMSAYDFDSTPDEIADNDKGGVPNSATDNEYNDNGSIDEDDQDPAVLRIFDLALRKTVNKSNVESTDEEITYTFTVFNQGGVAAKNVEIVDHLPDGFDFDASLNSHWQSVNSNLVRTKITSVIDAGESVSIDLILTLNQNGLGKELINVGEISSAQDVSGAVVPDYDSTPDLDDENDAGGEVNTPTDNEINGNGVSDEDDHDPAVIFGVPQMIVDVSLNKSVNTTHMQAGGEVIFTLEVMNEESVTVGRLRIVDYLPFFLENMDPEWALSNNGLYIYRDLEIGEELPADGLKTGEVASVTLTTRVRNGVPPGPILNTAEISLIEAFDQGSQTISFDKDSQPDDDPNNDRSDNPKEVTGGAGSGSRPIEDDRGAAEVVVCLIERLDTCTCLNNESNEFDGQFTETIQVTSASDEEWFIQEAVNIFRSSSPNPPAAPTPFAGDMLVETPLGGGISTYTISGVFTEGTAWYMVVRNNFDAIHSVEGGQECRYEHPSIIGPNSVCVNGTEDYEIIPATPGATYSWSVGSGGTIVAGGTGPRITVQWEGTVSGPHTVTATEVSPDECTAPASMAVEIGDQFVFSMSCIQDAQISIGPNCESKVTPQILLTGGPYDYDAFSVMLSDEHGHPIPNATLTYEHVGKRIMAKVMNACTGNSCWSWITVEDKIGPEIICFNDTVLCASMGKYPAPVAIDACDPDPVIHFLNESVEPIDCDPEFIKRVTRTYVAEDEWGNFGDTCTQEIMLRRIIVDSIDYPDTFSIANGNPLICNSFPADSNGLPLPEFTGIPMYGDVPLYPEEYYCSISVDYKDIELQQIGCVRKLVREWRIVEWYCTTGFNLIRYPQYIEITDTVAPSVICPDVEYVVTNTRSCDADVWLELPDVTDNCSDSFRIDVVYPGGFVEDFRGGQITLPVDTNLVKFRVYDECYNVDSCEFEIIVEDNTPPVAVCDQFTTVGLTDTGLAYIYAETFDDGSYDNCALKKLEVKRMDDGANCGWIADTFGAYVEFCCEDVGRPVMVMFRATDKSGNQNTCMVEVEVQDKIPPQIYCPPNDTITCEFHYDTSDLSQFGMPVILDNCDYTLEERVVENVDQCREGYLERIFIVRDSNNISTCVQRIYIINETPFTEDDITWPLDLDTTECREGFLTPDLLPDPYGYPQVDEDFCDLVGITYTDHTFPFVSNTEACYKIVRTWKVINWCRFDSSTYDTWIYDQVIKVQNETPPTITSDCEEIEKCIYDNCEFGYIELFATATDDCTDTSELRWEYHVDLDSDGIDDYSAEGFGPRIDIAREFRLGEHNVRYVFEDGCGNKTVCTQFFDLVNCKGPTAYCKNGIVVDLIPMDLDGDGECDIEMVEIWAEDLNDNSFHPCDYPLTYSFGRDTSVKAVMYDCDDLGRRELEVCVTDSRGYQSCCSTFVIVQDNNFVDCCPTTFDKDCIVPPADVNLTDCMASTDPDDLMSFPMTDNCMVDSVQVEFEDEDGTNGDVCLKIKRTWTVTLFLDGIDTACQFTHCIIIDNEFTEDSIIWPEDTLMLDDCVIDLDTAVTGGVPVLLGEYCDFVTLDYTDVPLEDQDPACRSFLRTWTVVNACDNDKTFTYDQIIEYRNQAPPMLTVPGDVTVNTDPGSCTANVTLPEATTTGDCNTGVTIVNTFSQGGGDASGEYPIGQTSVIFTATDDCGNISTAVTVVVVQDMEPPTITCPDDLMFDCDVDLEDVDFGDPVVNDNCMDVTVSIDTMMTLNGCNIGNITRTITATDNSGNVSTCTQEIVIENQNPLVEDDITWPMDSVVLTVCDSTSPEFTGEPVVDVTGVSCVDLTIEFMDTMYMSTCDGGPCTIIERTWTVTDSCQFDGMGGGVFTFLQVIEVDGEPLMIFCPGDTTITCEEGLGDLDLYGVFSAESECGIASETLDTVYNLNTCDVGTVTRTYTVMDSAGIVMMCAQTITIEIDIPFTEDRITWPQDSVTVGSCDSMVMTGEPVIDTMGLSCFDITISSSDTMYVDTCDGEPCDVLRRKWTVIDSCQLDGMGGGMFCDTQIIVVAGNMLSISCPPDTLLDCADTLQPLEEYGTLTFVSPCGVDTVIRDTIYELNACSLGTITRTLFVRDTVGNELSCSQTITVGTDMPFMEDDITWPNDSVFIDNCTSTDPDSLMNGRPVIDSTALECANLSIDYIDSLESSCDMEPCLTIYRDWTVVDSCQLDSLGAGVFTFRQVIEVNDTTPPTFNVMSIDTTIASDSLGGCMSDLMLVVSAMDCSPNVIITNDSPFADSTGADASGRYPPGVTNFFFYAEDGCCNRDSIPVRVEVIDTLPPSIVCTKVFRTMFDSIQGVKFFAEDPVFGISDNCTDLGNFRYSFSLNDPSDTCRFYNCDSLRATGLPDLLYREVLYVFDEAGNVDSCDALLQVVDSSGCIDKGLTVTVAGLVQTEGKVEVAEAQVKLEGPGGQAAMTDFDGHYEFLPMFPGGTYELSPYKNDDPLNGVTTKDLVFIQRHLLGKDELDSPYQRIAADINNSQSISAADMSELRRMLLGYYEEFPNNTSWRFVDEEYVFPQPDNPWVEEWPESYMIDPLESDMNVDFTGVKIGDVTGDVSFGLDANSTRQNDAMVIEYEMRDGHYSFYKASEEAIGAFQMTMSWLPDGEMEIVLNEDAWLTEEDFGYHSLKSGLLPIAADVELPEGRVLLFEVPASAVASGFGLSDEITLSLAYGLDWSDKEVVIRPIAESHDTYTLYQNRPNPFRGTTSIGFDLPFIQNARLTIMNVNGQIVHVTDQEFEKGYNEIVIDKEILQGSGIYYYRLDCEGYSEIMKMINID